MSSAGHSTANTNVYSSFRLWNCTCWPNAYFDISHNLLALLYI